MAEVNSSEDFKSLVLSIVVNVEDIAELNKKLILRKFNLYKSIESGNVDVLNELLELVDKQIELIGKEKGLANIYASNSSIIKSIFNFADKSLDSKAKGYISTGKDLLNELVNALNEQKKVLENKNFEPVIMFQMFRKNFRAERAVYNKYNALSKQVISDFSLWEAELKELKNYKDPSVLLSSLGICVSAFTVLSLFSGQPSIKSVLMGFISGVVFTGVSTFAQYSKMNALSQEIKVYLLAAVGKN